MRVMIATAQQADELKAAAGIAATGRKSAKSVYAYSLSWHPDEAATLDRAEMMKAAESSLIALGAEGYQAVIVAHQDEPQPHVHVIVNRVHPDTGKLFVPSNDFRTLDRWALAYRERRGEAEKYCPKRAENRDRALAAKSPEKAQEPRKPAPAPEPPQQRPPSRGAVLAQQQADMKARHAQAWKDAGAAYKAQREKVWQERPSFKAIAAQHREETRPLWSALGKEEWRERKAFRAREQSLGGIFRNALDAVKAKGIDAGNGHLTAIVSHVFNSGERTAVFELSRSVARDQLRRALREQLDGKIAAAKADHAAKLAQVRAEYDTARAAMKGAQDLERGKMRNAWAEHYAARDQAQPRGGRSWSRPTVAPDREKARRAALVAARAARADPPPRLDREARGAKPWREQPHANRYPVPQKAAQPRQEPPTMQHEFDDARKLRGANIFAAPAKTAPIPAPQPAPTGTAPAPQQRQDVPKVDRAADFAKTQQGKDVIARQAPKAAPDPLRSQGRDVFAPASSAPAKPTPTAPPNRDIWSKAAQPQPQQTDEKKQEMRDIWSGAAKPKAAPDRRRDRDNDLEPEM
jgi:hypothetical protein